MLARRLPLERIRAHEGAESVIDDADWAALGEIGVFSLTLPEPAGVGLGLPDAVVVFEELGRALVPGPLVGTFLAAASGLVDGAAEGRVQVGVHCEGDGPVLIEHLGTAGAILVLSGPSGDAEARLMEAEALRQAARPVAAPLDPLTPLWVLDALPTTGTPTQSGPQLRRDGTLLAAALQIGHAAAALDLAVAYAKERQQFGKPIGTFQAVKHMCADMLVRAEVARSAVLAAACLIDQPDVAAEEAQSTGRAVGQVVARATLGAKLLADEAAVANARVAIQVHGGMGFTWEVPLHLHLKRSRLLATTFGTPSSLSAVLSTLI
jgi:alkylation response protein AidB-like acyl-CoA dehydrogenase